IRQDIIERTDGIPLFVEEMTKAVLEAGSEGAAEHAAAAVPLPALAVPASLHASLMARLDRLGTPKDGAQIGAALRAGLFPRPAGCGGAPAGGRAGIGGRPSDCGRFTVPARRAAARHLPVQAFPGAGCGLWDAAAAAATRPSRAHRRNPREPICGRR